MVKVFVYFLIASYFTDVSIAYLNRYSNVIQKQKIFQLRQKTPDIRDNEKQSVLNDVSVLIKDLSSGKLEKDDFEKKITSQEIKFQELKYTENLVLEKNTLIGTSLIGVLLGLLIDVNVYSNVNPSIPPLISTILLTSAMYYVLNNDKTETIATYSKKYIGKNTVSIIESIEKEINSYIEDQIRMIELKKQNTIEYIQNIPENTKNNINDYIETKTNDIKASIEQIPVTIQSNIETKANDIQTSIQQIPVKIQSSIETKIDDIKEETNNAVKAQINNIQAIPERTSKSIETSIQKSTQSLLALPGTILNRARQIIEIKIIETQNEFNMKINTLNKRFNEINPFYSEKIISKNVIVKSNEIQKQLDKDIININTPAVKTDVNKPVVKFESKPEMNIESKPVVKVESKPAVVQIKVENKPAVKAEILSKPVFNIGNFGVKTSTTTPAKVEIKPALKNESKPVLKVESKPAVKVENKPAVKVENKSAVKVEVNPTIAAKPEILSKPVFNIGNFAIKASTTTPSKVETKPVLKNESKPATKMEIKPVPKVEPASVVKVESKSIFNFGNFATKTPTVTSAKVETKPIAKSETKSLVKVNVKPVVRIQSQSVTKNVDTSKSGSTSIAVEKNNLNVDVRNLNSKIVKLINAISSKNPNAIKEIDIALGDYIATKTGPETFYRQLVISLNSKDAAFTILPDIIGLLPASPIKKALNNYYQQSA